MNTFASLGKASRTRTIVKTTSLPFGVNSAYEAVARVHQYPEFLSWCTRVDIVEEPRSLPGSVEKLVCAIDYGVTGSDRLDLSAIGFTSGTLESLNHLVIRQPDTMVKAIATGKKHFEKLTYEWRFEPKGTPSRPECFVSLKFEIVLSSLVHLPAWELASHVMVDRVAAAFMQRAAAIEQGQVVLSDEPPQIDRESLTQAEYATEQTINQVREADSPTTFTVNETMQQLLEVPAAVMNQTAEVLRVPMRVQITPEGADYTPAPARDSAEESFQTIKPGALQFVTAEEVDVYAQAILTSGRLQSIGFGALGSQLELKAYAHIIKIMLVVVHESLWAVHGVEMFGYEVMLKKLAKAGKRTSSHKFNLSSADSVNPAVLEQFVDKMSTHPKSNAKFLPTFLRHRLYKNCAVLVFNLMADLTTSSKIGFMGHQVTFGLSPDPEPVEVQWLSHNIDTQLEDQMVRMLVDEILIDSDLNFTYVPDSLEREVYTVSTRFVVRIIEQILAQMRMRVLDVDAEISLTPCRVINTRGEQLVQLAHLKKQVADLEAKLRCS